MFTLREFFAQSLILVKMSRKTWATGQKGLLILYLSQNSKYTLLSPFFNFELFIFENEIQIDVCLLLSREGGALKTRSQRDNNNKTQKLKMSKHFSMYF